MATYKLIQDIEAEDKILGPLTLRQFIYGMAAAFMLYLSFIVTVKHAAFLLVVFLPPALFCAFFAFPFGRDQPTEVWALAKLRFFFKPRKRVWNQSGVKELVTITAPKKVERVLTKGFSQTEVKSRLHALADTLDSRGWAVKNIDPNVYQSTITAPDSDRLLDISSLPQNVPSSDIVPADDILDDTNSPIARQFGAMIDESSRLRRQQLMEQLNDIRQTEATKQSSSENSGWFMGDDVASTSGVTNSTNDDALSASLATKASSQKTSFGNLRTLQPLKASRSQAKSKKAADTSSKDNSRPMTTPDDPGILSLAKNNDLNVATLAREAQKNKGDDEVVISLH